MYDMVVVGAGPSGTAAAHAAVSEGLKVLIIEKESFPRYKPCGGALSERLLSYLEFEIPEPVMEKEIYGMRIELNGEMIESRKDHRLGILVTRSKFDEFLLEKAVGKGAEVHLEERVLSIQECEEDVLVKTENDIYRARYAVIAEGAQGVLKRSLGNLFMAKGSGVSMVAEIEAKNSDIDRDLSGLIHITLGVVPNGYGWIFPHDGYYSVGVGSFMPGGCTDPKGAMGTFLKKTGLPEPSRIRGHLIPQGGHRIRLTSNRLLLCGDAAGFVDAVTGEGIYYAIRTGQIAGRLVSKIIRGDYPRSSLKKYDELSWSEVGHKLKHTLAASAIIYKYPRQIFNLLRDRPEAFQKFLEIHSMKRQYMSFLMWLMIRLPRYFFSRI